MTVEYLPVGVKCNLKCTYCYQEPMREAGNFSVPLNFVKVKAALDSANSDFSLFGGEPLLASLCHLNEVFDYGFQRHGHNGIQTNGLLITSEHIEMFKKYNVQVGVSIDGAGSLNRARSTAVETETIIDNIKQLCATGISTSLITTLHALNSYNIIGLLEFFEEMETAGVTFINLHNLEVDTTDAVGITLSDKRNFLTFKAIYDYSKTSKLKFNPFQDIKELLTKTNPVANCVWNGCDPLTTPAVHGINAAGDLTNCGRTNKNGIDWMKASSQSLERYTALAQTEWKHGGCRGCKYFFACKGQCPGTAIAGDWRNRTRDCQFWYMLIDYIRLDLESRNVPLLDFDAANATFVSNLNNGIITSHGDSPHMDTPHGDSHGDHNDEVHKVEYHGDHTDSVGKRSESTH